MSRVLIVENDLWMADLLEEALTADGYDVTGIARTVEQALRLADEDRPDVAVVDVCLANGESGIDVGTYLCQIFVKKLIPVCCLRPA